MTFHRSLVCPLSLAFSAVALACGPTSSNNPDGSSMTVDDSASAADAVVGADGSDASEFADGSSLLDGSVTDPCAGGRCPVVTQLSFGEDHVCALLSGGTLKCWGRNNSAQLGDGTTMVRSRPTMSLATNVAQVSGGFQHTCAVRMDGTVWCWGSGALGQLGNGAMADSMTPVQVTGITTATKVVAGAFASCALLRDHSVRCWGRGTDLGNNTITPSAVPVTTMNLTDAADISMGFTSTRGMQSQTACALRMNGAIRCWGFGGEGQIGDGTRNNARVPTDVMGITNARVVVAGGSHICAVLMDNTVRCWGDNGSAQLGDGTTEFRALPITAVGVNNVRTLSLGDRYSCAILMDGTAQCWGAAGRGQLGRGELPPVGTPIFPTPARVAGLTNIVAMGTGEESACAYTMDGVTRCWGDDIFGQLGNGIETVSERFPSPIPVQW